MDNYPEKKPRANSNDIIFYPMTLSYYTPQFELLFDNSGGTWVHFRLKAVLREGDSTEESTPIWERVFFEADATLRGRYPGDLIVSGDWNKEHFTRVQNGESKDALIFVANEVKSKIDFDVPVPANLKSATLTIEGLVDGVSFPSPK